jgi:hypothetical protein
MVVVVVVVVVVVAVEEEEEWKGFFWSYWYWIFLLLEALIHRLDLGAREADYPVERALVRFMESTSPSE